MVLRNWYNAWRAQSGTMVIPDGLVSYADVSVDAGYYGTGSNAATTLFLSNTTWGTMYENNCVLFGSGTTPATLDDYNMESIITSGLSVSSGKGNDDNGNRTYLYTITNTSADDITIGEIGMTGFLYTGNNKSGKYVYALVERTVLDSPVTIPAGGVGVVTYTIHMKYPT